MSDQVAAHRLIAAIQDLSLAQDLDAIVATVRRAARELSGADGATFVLREGDLCCYVDEDAIGPLWRGRRFPMDACISGWVMRHCQAVVIADVYDDERIPADVYRPTFVKSLAMVPIRAVDPIGAIGNYWAATHAASAEEVNQLRALADATAVAMERVRVYQELEQRVRERTSELEEANRRLVDEIEERRGARQGRDNSGTDARRSRQERVQLASVLASGIAHELNQPLSAAITYADVAVRLLRRHGGDHGQAIELMEKASAQNWRAVSIIRQFRELLRRGVPELQAVELDEVVRSAVECVEASAREAGFAVGVDIGEDLGRVRCERRQIEHVVQNLLRNGLEAMRDAGIVRGSLRVRARPGRPGYAQVSVSDDGPGLSAEARTKLFMHFHTTKGSGLGLGLSVSKSIVEAHGGQLWVDSGGQGGATFHFTLPLSESEQRQQQQRERRDRTSVSG